MRAFAGGQKLTHVGDTSTLTNMALVIPASVVPFRKTIRSSESGSCRVNLSNSILEA
jgi:hypothetical protein